MDKCIKEESKETDFNSQVLDKYLSLITLNFYVNKSELS